MHAVVTGSSGFIGGALAEALEAEGHTLLRIDVASNCDITDGSALEKCFAGTAEGDIDVIFHLAARMYVPDSWNAPKTVYDANLTGTLNILEQARKFDVNKFIFASSYIYGQTEYLPVDETHPVKPNNPYAHSKYIAEQLCRSYFEDYGIGCVILRPFNVFGPGQSEKFLIPTIIGQLAGGSITLQDPEPKRDFLYVSDMVNAYKKASLPGPDDFEIFNIGSGKSYSVSEVVDLVLKISGKTVPVNYTGKRRDGEVMDVVADITKAKNRLGWAPEVDIEDGIKRIMDGQ